MLQVSIETATTEKKGRTQTQNAEEMPPTSHALMDLVVALSVYLPRPSYTDLFSLVASILPQNADAQLQKKAYKLMPRLATVEAGLQALRDRSAELQELLLSTAASASVPARRGRLAAIATIVETLPPTHLHFIPSVLPEVVVAAKEVNAKARGTAFELLTAMGRKMAAGGVVAQSKIPHMAADAPGAPASLDEFFTMVSAGLAGTAPHMVSASINALTHLAHAFRVEMTETAREELTGALLLFMGTNDREVAQSALGFVKLAVIALPEPLVRPRLQEIVTGILRWSKQNHNKLRTRVKHLFERLIRRFGYDTIIALCPEDDKRLVHNIQRTKEQKRRRKDRAHAAAAEGGVDANALHGARPATGKRPGRFDAALDNALADSDSDDTDSSNSSESDNGGVPLGRSAKGKGRPRKNGAGDAYIVEDEDEPLDLLDRSALAHIATSRPVRFRPEQAPRRKTPARTNARGRLVIAEEDGAGAAAPPAKDGDAEMRDADGAEGGGVGAYVEAITGKDAAQRGLRGKLKFSNRRRNAVEEKADDGQMDVDDGAVETRNGHGEQEKKQNGVGARGGRGKGTFVVGKRGGQPERRGLDESKVRSGGSGFKPGRVTKNGGFAASRRGGRK